MKIITVDYILNDQEYNRLEELADLFTRASGNPYTPDQTFRALMLVGCAKDIEDRMNFLERNLTAVLKATA